MRFLDLLVVIPCYNEAEHIEKLVKKLIEQKPKLIVVADGGSTDGTCEILHELVNRYDNVRIINNERRIQSAAINMAVKLFGDEYKYFVRIDAHGEYPHNFLETLLDEAYTQDADSIVITMNTVGKQPVQKAIAAAQNSKLGNGGSAHRNENANGRWVEHGHHALMKVDSFLNVGGYDESFVANEDAELDKRLSLSGYKIWLTSKTNMTYFPRSSLASLFKQYYRYGVGRACNMFKHKTYPNIRQAIPLSVVPVCLLSLFGFLHPVFTFPMILWVSICLMFGLFLAINTKSLVIVLSGVSAVVMHSAWSLGFCVRSTQQVWKVLKRNKRVQC